ncbi:hypothetical protein HPB49_010797 [Dermacentor silvarum]|uniref:Uncharacterized protein n=1 Tax=Dermacentor silvarum TaxID=543639 RepID=A0ACB8D4I9_DERSI|nr:hypothetical protein HPB49_010797 [Dermacentor silvarum]
MAATSSSAPEDILQWNCRGIAGKVGELRQRLRYGKLRVWALLIQETNALPPISGFVAYSSPSMLDLPTRRRDHPRAPPHSPDLSWWLGRTTVSWSCEPDCWGSDHHPIHLGLPSGGTGRLRRLCRVVDWDRYRAVSESTVSSFVQDPPHCLSVALVGATRTSWVDESRTTPDLQLLRLWASRRQAELASERDPSSNSLRLEAQRLTAVARRHEHRLERGRWIDWCSSLDPSSSNASIWRTFCVMERGRRPPEPAACALLASGQTPAVFAETVAHTFFPALDTAPPLFVVQNSLTTDAGTPPTLADIEAARSDLASARRPRRPRAVSHDPSAGSSGYPSGAGSSPLVVSNSMTVVKGVRGGGPGWQSMVAKPDHA